MMVVWFTAHNLFIKCMLETRTTKAMNKRWRLNIVKQGQWILLQYTTNSKDTYQQMIIGYHLCLVRTHQWIPIVYRLTFFIFLWLLNYLSYNISHMIQLQKAIECLPKICCALLLIIPNLSSSLSFTRNLMCYNVSVKRESSSCAQPGTW